MSDLGLEIYWTSDWSEIFEIAEFRSGIWQDVWGYEGMSDTPDDFDFDGDILVVRKNGALVATARIATVLYNPYSPDKTAFW
jgi:hypothetical protein